VTAVETGTTAVAVLIVSRTPADYETLRGVLCGSKWSLYSAPDVPAALRQMRRHTDISLLVCDRELWKEMLDSITDMPGAPVLIVSATKADEQLWAEALNVGAYDVLAKPFDTAEVVRSLSLGWLHWRRRNERVTCRTPSSIPLSPLPEHASGSTASLRRHGSSRSSALLVVVTRCDQRRVF
jgi:CheY-like chemotaxis protein